MSLIPQLAPTFEAALRDRAARRAEARRAAAERLGRAPEGREAEAADALRSLADDANPTVRRAALVSLGRVGDRDATALVAARIQDGDPRVRQAAVIAAGALGGDELLSAIRTALESPFPDVRFQAAMSYVEAGGEGALSALTPLLDDTDPEVRSHAAEALGVLCDPAAADALAVLLDDPSPPARTEAALALARLRDTRATRVLRHAVHHPDWAVAAALALRDLGDDAARDDLARVAAKKIVSPILLAAVGGALARLGDPRGVEALRRALSAFRPYGRSLAAEIAGDERIVELVPELVALAKRPRGADPVILTRALSQLAKVSDAARAALSTLATGDGEPARLAREALAG